MGQRLDTYDKMPPAMKNYLSLYGWHFSKKMCEWAVSKMEVENKTTKQEEKLVPIKKEEVEELLKKYGIKLDISPLGEGLIFLLHGIISIHLIL